MKKVKIPINPTPKTVIVNNLGHLFSIFFCIYTHVIIIVCVYGLNFGLSKLF